ncbi:TraB/GumN family protein [Ideonella alba]|uniref:TraB/GumN family protein n=1 Tax=Ideonella alba TaxID=2824118 RepID=A0A941BDT7_9BURK|nr:TraB/GumN family protein [Ideonella alba]MBQ0929252.1 TraB/GumN family protein [Ideonella alba]
MTGGWRGWVARLWSALLCSALVGLAPPALAKPPACPPAAQAPDAATLAQWQAQARDRGLLWRYEKDGRSGWLFGTLHVGRGPWSVPGPALSLALEQADRLVLEIDPLADDTQSALRAPTPASGPAPAAPPKALAARLRRQLERACVGTLLDGLTPSMQAVTLLALSARGAGLDPAWGQEPMLSQRFHQARRPVESIETVDQQVQALVGGDELDTLRQALDELENPASMAVVNRLAEAWAAGDLATLSAYPRWCRCLDTAQQRAEFDRVVLQRNARMAAHIERLHAAGARPLVAVGALHLVGEDGLPQRLQRAGFRLTRLGPGAP